MLAQVQSSKRMGIVCDLFRCAGGNNVAAKTSTTRAHIDQVVSGRNEIEVMLDDENGVSPFDEALENRKKFRDIIRM